MIILLYCENPSVEFDRLVSAMQYRQETPMRIWPIFLTRADSDLSVHQSSSDSKVAIFFTAEAEEAEDD